MPSFIHSFKLSSNKVIIISISISIASTSGVWCALMSSMFIIHSKPQPVCVCICFPPPGRGLPYGSGLGLSRCLGPGECLHSFIQNLKSEVTVDEGCLRRQQQQQGCFPSAAPSPPGPTLHCLPEWSRTHTLYQGP